MICDIMNNKIWVSRPLKKTSLRIQTDRLTEIKGHDYVTHVVAMHTADQVLQCWRELYVFYEFLVLLCLMCL